MALGDFHPFAEKGLHERGGGGGGKEGRRARENVSGDELVNGSTFKPAAIFRYENMKAISVPVSRNAI